MGVIDVGGAVDNAPIFKLAAVTRGTTGLFGICATAKILFGITSSSLSVSISPSSSSLLLITACASSIIGATATPVVGGTEIVLLSSISAVSFEDNPRPVTVS